MEQKRKAAEERKSRPSTSGNGSPTTNGGDKGNLQTLKRQLVREEILRSAATLFAERGVRAVSIDDIASALGYTKSSVYYYFRSKGDLLWSIFGYISEHFMGEAEKIAKSYPDPSERLVELIKMHVRFNAEHREWGTLFYRDVTALPAERQSKVRKNISRYHTIFRQTVQEGVASGEMQSLSPDVVVHAVTGACNWLVNWISLRHNKSVEEIADTFVKLFTAGLNLASGPGRTEAVDQKARSPDSDAAR
jgi:AcrR family transcriptional regulator